MGAPCPVHTPELALELLDAVLMLEPDGLAD